MKTTTAFAVASSLSGLASALPYMGPGTLEMREQMTTKNSTWTDLRGKVGLSLERSCFVGLTHLTDQARRVPHDGEPQFRQHCRILGLPP